ncbi:hypothetical protein BJX76DRAFT_24581 [Aspergillus varians]
MSQRVGCVLFVINGRSISRWCCSHCRVLLLTHAGSKSTRIHFASQCLGGAFTSRKTPPTGGKIEFQTDKRRRDKKLECTVHQ